MFRRAAAFLSTKAPVPSNVPKPVLPAHIISGAFLGVVLAGSFHGGHLTTALAPLV